MLTSDKIIELQDIALQGKGIEELPAEEQVIVKSIESRINEYMTGLNELLKEKNQ